MEIVIDEERLELYPLFPIGDDVDIEDIDFLLTGSDTNLIEDEELGNRTTIELLGRTSRASFITHSKLRYLVCHVKTLGRFFMMSIIVKDNKGIDRVFEFSNHRTIVVVNDFLAEIPLEIKERGWQRVCIDMVYLTRKAFGTDFVSCTDVIITGSCRFACIYLQAKIHQEPQLPSYLRVLSLPASTS